MANAESDTVVPAFTEEQAERLTHVSRRQLRYWDRTNFYKPAYGAEQSRAAFSRIYSFRDVASLRVLNMLRNQYGVPLQHLRKVAESLVGMSESKWTATVLYVLNKKVVFREPSTEQFAEIVGGQYVFGIPLRIVAADTRRDVIELQRRDASTIGKFDRARGVSHNKLVVAGTRIPVASIKRFAEDGFSVEQIMKEYPTLTEADVKAAIEHKDDGLAA